MRIFASFNPCSIGNCSGRTLFGSNRLGALEVSILVLLEIALEVLQSCPGASCLVRSFNPCSIGNCSGSWQRCISPMKLIISVSILVLLEIALEVGSYFRAFYAHNWFQSLFYWKLLWKIVFIMPIRPSHTSFNPCSIGNCSGSRLSLSRPPPSLSFNPCSIGNCSGRRVDFVFKGLVFLFQSLFYWKLLWKRRGAILAFAEK